MSLYGLDSKKWQGNNSGEVKMLDSDARKLSIDSCTPDSDAVCIWQKNEINTYNRIRIKKPI